MMIMSDAILCQLCERNPTNVPEDSTRHGADWECRTCNQYSECSIADPKIDLVLQEIYDLATAVTSKAITRRLTHQTCDRIRDLVEKALDALELESEMMPS